MKRKKDMAVANRADEIEKKMGKIQTKIMEWEHRRNTLNQQTQLCQNKIYKLESERLKLKSELTEMGSLA